MGLWPTERELRRMHPDERALVEGAMEALAERMEEDRIDRQAEEFGDREEDLRWYP
jgi:hypothetical protein